MCSHALLYLLYLSTSFLWWLAVAGILGGTSSTALRMNLWCTWRHSRGARNVYNTAIRCALSPLRPYGGVTADVHDCPRRIAPLRHLELKATAEVFLVRPSFLLPYMVGRTEAVEKALYLRHWGVPFDALV